jgi:peptidoglycan/LPS O-acetylase OafA/YrhL
MENGRIFGLDLLRVKAIGLVLMAQCLWIFPRLNGLISQAASVFHFIGVEVLLVLSGFLLYLKLFPIYVNGRLDKSALLGFLKRKLLLIVPLFYLALLLSFLVARLWGYQPVGIWPYFLFLNGFCFSPDALFPGSWVVAVIFWANLFLPIILWLSNRIFKPENKSVFFIRITIVLLLLSFFAKVIYHQMGAVANLNVWDSALKTVVIYRLDSVFIGVAMGWLLQHFDIFNKLKTMFLLLGFAGVLFLFAGVGFFQLLIETHPLFWNVFYLPTASLIICCFLPILYAWKSAQPSLQNPITFGSKISYAFYLLHFSVILQLMQLYFVEYLTDFKAVCVFIGLYVLLAFIVSALVWQFYQKRFLKD